MAKTTKRTTERERTAAVAYTEQTAEIAKYMATINAALDVHANAFRSAGSRDWGFVGDVAHFADELRTIASRFDLSAEDAR